MKATAKRIIVVDDDVLVRNLLRELLILLGYDVECVSNGEEALVLLKKGRYDVLITDHIMPGIGGIELTEKIRGMDTRLPIIGISGSSNEKDFLAAGANIFMSKPVNLKQLKEALKFISGP